MIHLLTLAGYLLSPQPTAPARVNSSEAPILTVGDAIWSPQYREGPIIKVCGGSIRSAAGFWSTEFPNGYGANTYLLLPTERFGGEGLFVKLKGPPPSSDAPCVTGVIIRTDGLSEEAAGGLGLYTGTFADVPDSVRMLHECNDRASCDALLSAIRSTAEPLSPPS